ncbi:MAG: methyl-accepting chemotaxis protein [Rhodopila sp.]
MLQCWMSLAELQQRVIQTLAAEVAHTSAFVETEADALSQRFQTLATGAQEQTDRVATLTSLAVGIDVDGKVVTVDEISRLLEDTLDDVVAKILLLSKDSMSMVGALDALNGNVRRVETCLGQIDEINRVTQMVAINARIEAERSGAAGATFRVVADEMNQLSKSIRSIAVSMRNELTAISGGIEHGHATLRHVATADMSANIMVKERLDMLLPALVRRNADIRSVVADAAGGADTMSADVSGIITGIQFQDRTKQRLEHVVDTLHVVGEAFKDIMTSTRTAAPELAEAREPDVTWVKSLLSRFTMSEMRERFVAQIIDGRPIEWPADKASTEDDSIELF